MKKEESVKNVEWLLCKDIEQKYGMKIKKLEKMKLGTAQCYKIQAERNLYFAKIYQKKHKFEQITREIQICQYLNDNNMNVSVYVKNLQGEFINIQEYGIFTIQKYINGITYEKYAVPENVLYQSAEILANIHKLLGHFSGFNIDFSPKWIREMADSSENAKKIEKIIKKAENMPDHSLKDMIIEDCKWKIKMLPSLSRLQNEFNSLTRKNSHGDYNTYQWICEKGKIKTIIDFGSCSNLPIIWEMIRSYTYAAQECSKIIEMNMEYYCRYLSHYLKNNTLSCNDLQRGFAFYYYTLMPSTFGYKQYIDDYMKGKYNNLIEFAFWRTRMCQYLAQNADFLDNYVCEKIGVVTFK